MVESFTTVDGEARTLTLFTCSLNPSRFGTVNDRWTILPVIWPARQFLSKVEISPTLACEVVHWVLRCVAFHLVPPLLMVCFVDNLDDCGKKKRSFGSFGEGMLCVVLRAVAVNCQK